jgi:hypothetical protein
MSHTKSSNSYFGHTAVPLELRNSSEVRLLITPPAYDSPQTTFVVPYKHSARIHKKRHVVSVLLCDVTAYAEVCLPSRCLETGCITPLFYCCVGVMQGAYRAVAWQCVDMSQY